MLAARCVGRPRPGRRRSHLRSPDGPGQRRQDDQGAAPRARLSPTPAIGWCSSRPSEVPADRASFLARRRSLHHDSGRRRPGLHGGAGRGGPARGGRCLRAGLQPCLRAATTHWPRRRTGGVLRGAALRPGRRSTELDDKYAFAHGRAPRHGLAGPRRAPHHRPRAGDRNLPSTPRGPLRPMCSRASPTTRCAASISRRSPSPDAASHPRRSSRGLPIGEDQPVGDAGVRRRAGVLHPLAPSRDGRVQLHCCCESSAFQLNYAMVDRCRRSRQWVRRFVGRARAHRTGVAGLHSRCRTAATARSSATRGPILRSRCSTTTPASRAAFLQDVSSETITPTAASRPTYWLYHELWRAMRQPGTGRMAALRRDARAGQARRSSDWEDPLPFLDGPPRCRSRRC